MTCRKEFHSKNKGKYEDPSKANADIIQQWRSLSPDERFKYNDAARKDREAYMKAHPSQ